MEDVKELMFRILEILRASDYHISTYYLQHMEFLIEHTVVCQVNSIQENQTITLFDYQKRPVKSISIYNVAQTIDVIPIFHDGEQINIAPTLILPENADKRIVLHEICHLLSIGPYRQSENYFLYHRFGICEFSYNFCNHTTEAHMISGHEGINELLTDYAAWYFMNLLYGQTLPFYSGTKRFGKYLTTLWKNGITVETLIGWYFSGNVVDMSKFLLNNRFQNYKYLYIAVYEFRTGPVDEKKKAIIDSLYGSVPDCGLTLDETKAERRNKQ